MAGWSQKLLKAPEPEAKKQLPVFQRTTDEGTVQRWDYVHHQWSTISDSSARSSKTVLDTKKKSLTLGDFVPKQ